jgi:branched-chain amino acid transport system substrate-binding protein
MTTRRPSRRTFLRATATGLAITGFPLPLRAQAKTVKVGAVHTVTGPLAEPGQACRAGAQLAVETINAAGGIKSLGGAKIELVLGDTQTKADVARTEAERVINQGAQLLIGAFDSGSTAAMVPVVQQRRIPFLVDIAAADPITANVAKSVKEGQQKVQYVYRNFPTGSSFGRRAVQYFNEIFKETGQNPKRVVVMHANDLFGQNQARGFKAAWEAAKPSWEIVDQRAAPASRADQAACRRPRDHQPREPGPVRGGPDRGAEGAARVRDGQRTVAELQEPEDGTGRGGVPEAHRRQDVRHELRIFL